MSKKIVFLFPGQGAQYVGMGNEFIGNYPEAKNTFQEANEALGFDLMKLCLEGDIRELTKTENTQPAILTTSVAAYRVYMKELGVKPHLSAGHSLGEISALACAGAISFSDAVKIVRKRGQFMQEAVPEGVGTMAAIGGIGKESIKKVLDEVSGPDNIVVVSNYNSDQQIVISGHKAAVSAAGEKLQDLGARVIPLKVSAPFHSPLMEPAADKLRDELAKYTFSNFSSPVLSNVSARPYEGPSSIIENLTLQLVEAVRWQDSMEYMSERGITTGVELGPQNILRGLMKKGAREIETFSFEKKKDIEALKEDLKEELKNKITVITKCLASAVSTRNKNWNDSEYQTGVVQSYKKIEEIQDHVEKNGTDPTIEQMNEALNLLKIIFATKKVPLPEQKERFEEIFSETGTQNLFTNFEIPQ